MAYRVISFHYVITNGGGQTLDSSRNRDPFTFMESAGQIIPALEEAILELNQGDKKEITIFAADAYGVRDEGLVIKVERERLPAGAIKIGDRFRGGEGEGAPIFVVVEVSESHVILDGNHPLAGEDLVFNVEIIEIRDATSDEIRHGHAHGKGGHQHEEEEN